MQKREIGQQVFNVLVLGALVAAFAGVGWLFALAIREGATLVAAILASFATVGGALIVRYWDRRKELEAFRRQRLGEAYEQLASALAGHAMAQRKIEKVILDFTKRGLVYAGPGVLKAFRVWRDGLPDHDDWSQKEQRENALRYEAFIKAMRKDLGVSNWGLEQGDLGRAVLKDWDQAFASEPVVEPLEPDHQEIRASHRERSRR